MGRPTRKLDPALSKDVIWNAYLEGALVQGDGMKQLSGNDELRTMNEAQLRVEFENYYEVATFEPGSTYKESEYQTFRAGSLAAAEVIGQELSDAQIIRMWKVMDAAREKAKADEKAKKEEKIPPAAPKAPAAPAQAPAPKTAPAPAVPTGRPQHT